MMSVLTPVARHASTCWQYHPYFSFKFELKWNANFQNPWTTPSIKVIASMKINADFTMQKKHAKTHLENQKCTAKGFTKRHPKVCKWSRKEVGCKREACDFLHVTSAFEGNEPKLISEYYECVGYKTTWQDTRCVRTHEIQNTDIFFCLNCDSWIQNKMDVLSSDWTLLDIHGNLRGDV